MPQFGKAISYGRRCVVKSRSCHINWGSHGHERGEAARYRDRPHVKRVIAQRPRNRFDPVGPGECKASGVLVLHVWSFVLEPPLGLTTGQRALRGSEDTENHLSIAYVLPRVATAARIVIPAVRTASQHLRKRFGKDLGKKDFSRR